ncbi:MAG: TIGR00296 family protein [Candidatus Altiarchaeota archaeon]|nr:TIGR00296 family protein [Candidatus Altiarchaeota archaeon]
MALTPQQGVDIVSYARAVIEGHYSGSKHDVPVSLAEIFKEKRGVFVTLEKNRQLRGCIGFPEPIMPLGDAVRQAALAAALEDPRFPPVEGKEVGKLTVEVSVLTVPEQIKVKNPKDYVNEVKVGVHGLIVEKGFYRGLLLPQVPVEWKWGVEEFLSETCMKAGVSPDSWLAPGTKIYRFSAQVFSEEAPGGKAVERDLSR